MDTLNTTPHLLAKDHLDKPTTLINHKEAGDMRVKLTRFEEFLGLSFLVSWLFLFAGGIVIDTEKFRCVVSPGGVRELTIEARPGDAVKQEDICKDQEFWVPSFIKSKETANAFKLVASWLGIILFFLPLNLAMVSATAGALGAMGNRANLEDEQTPVSSRDDSNPILSGLLRGLFVYLFFISGLLLFDDKPFSNPGPGQYIRLAGFLSLISFLVNYKPNLFGTFTEWAFQRVNTRRTADATEEGSGKVAATQTEKTTHERITKVEVEGERTVPNGTGGGNQLSSPRIEESPLK